MTPVEILSASLEEDAPRGDLTSDSLIKYLNVTEEKTLGHFIAKQDLILSGLNFLKATSDLSLKIELETFFNDSAFVKKGQKIAQLYGPWNELVLVERSLLNILGRLSGIATMTSQFVEQVKHTKCKILDTRKTTPLYRIYEKKAVVHGGGLNHRLNLSAEIMLKENHICRIKDSLILSLIKLKEKQPTVKITIECQTLEEVKLVSEAPIDQILLDNMTLENTKKAVGMIPQKIKIEASGNMNLNRVKEVAELGVDFISVGLITHSAPTVDISFLIDK